MAQADSAAQSPVVGEWLMSAEASADSLDAYWSGMEQQWHAELSPEAGSTKWNRARVDSLSQVGDQELADLRDQNPGLGTEVPIYQGKGSQATLVVAQTQGRGA